MKMKFLEAREIDSPEVILTKIFYYAVNSVDVSREEVTVNLVINQPEKEFRFTLQVLKDREVLFFVNADTVEDILSKVQEF